MVRANFGGDGASNGQAGKVSLRVPIESINSAEFCGPQIVHGDLAARNVLVFPGEVVKVADFGMSRQLYGCTQYQMKKPVQDIFVWNMQT